MWRDACWWELLEWGEGWSGARRRAKWGHLTRNLRLGDGRVRHAIARQAEMVGASSICLPSCLRKQPPPGRQREEA